MISLLYKDIYESIKQVVPDSRILIKYNNSNLSVFEMVAPENVIKSEIDNKEFTSFFLFNISKINYLLSNAGRSSAINIIISLLYAEFERLDFCNPQLIHERAQTYLNMIIDKLLKCNKYALFENYQMEFYFKDSEFEYTGAEAKISLINKYRPNASYA